MILKASTLLRAAMVCVIIGAIACSGVNAQSFPKAAPPASIPTFSTENIAREGFFFAGGHYVGPPDKQVMGGAMYTEVLVPKVIKHPYPIVFMPVGGFSGIEFLQTPDGRPGWARWFVDQGYVVYTVDPPGRGRSPWVPDVDGVQDTIRTAQTAEKQWTDPEHLAGWPQAKKFTQWPGTTGHRGDPVFDTLANYEITYIRKNFEDLSQPAGVALLDMIGPAIIMAHAQNTGTAWLMADSRPKLVKGIIALQASGPPLQNVDTGNGNFTYRGAGRVWGVTFNPIHYDPPIKDPSELKVELQDKPEGPDLVPCWRQKEPARKLVNLIGIPVVVVSSEAGYHRPYDHCTAEWLNQAGVKTEFVGLEKVGLRGNDDLEPLEKNSIEIAKYLESWIEKNVH